jgi:hypothetical protein
MRTRLLTIVENYIVRNRHYKIDHSQRRKLGTRLKRRLKLWSR